MRANKRYPVLFLCLFLVLGLLFVPECGDCYFVYWRFDSLGDLLLTRPITEGLPVVGVPANGRYLGNLLGVLQGKLYFTSFGFLRGLLLGGGLAGLTILLGRRFSNGANGSGGLALAFSLVLLAPRGIWQQVYAWGAGFVNYLLPMVGILMLLELLRDERPNPAACFLMTLCCCLFLEPVTILLCLGGAAFAVQASKEDQGRKTAAWTVALGAVLGTALMFSHPGYSQVGSDSRAVGLELVERNLTVILTDALIRPAALALLLSVLLLFLLRQQGRRWKPWAAVLVPIHLLCIAGYALGLLPGLQRILRQASDTGLRPGTGLARPAGPMEGREGPPAGPGRGAGLVRAEWSAAGGVAGGVPQFISQLCDLDLDCGCAVAGGPKTGVSCAAPHLDAGAFGLCSDDWCLWGELSGLPPAARICPGPGGAGGRGGYPPARALSRLDSERTGEQRGYLLSGLS